MNNRPRPEFPKRAVITAGMPYGNKSLHFGHVGGVFVHADTLYRFLQDRIGKENVVFVSGTDCYGSPIVASYKKYCDETKNPKSLEDYVLRFHHMQKEVLEKFEIRPSLFSASAFGEGGRIHRKVSDALFEALYSTGSLQKLSTKQFYDEEAGAFLNGRQVVGKCPVDGCKSDKAFADECAMGHQYLPEELVDPVSTLTGKVPSLRTVENWYFDLPAYSRKLKDMIDQLKALKRIRPNVYSSIDEFLKKPCIYVNRKDHEALNGTVDPGHLIDDGKKPSVTYEYDNLDQRDVARNALAERGVKYRTGKTLVPFRLSGNVEWGVPVPERDGLKDLTFWVWPESLWAPISFTIAHLKTAPEKEQDWQEWWLSPEAEQYQVIGEDNVYFYGIAEMGLLMAYLGVKPDDEQLLRGEQYPQLVSNSHLLFMGTKASSSGSVKPPMAEDLLDHYTSDQLRMHFLGLGLSKKSASFSPLAYVENANSSEADPVLKDGNVLTNVYNRVLRSIFYTAQKHTDSRIPNREPSEEIKAIVEKGVLEYEQNMARKEFHLVIYAVDDLVRKVSKHWSKNAEDVEKVLADCFYASKVLALLLHPITPSSAENIREMMRLNDTLWSWDNVFAPIQAHMDSPDQHRIQEIPPRYDFYKKHHTQLSEE